MLENLANNSITYWKYGKLELNWEVLTELNENGEPNFYDSFIKHAAEFHWKYDNGYDNHKFHWKYGKRYDNQKVQRLMKSQEKSKEAESPVTGSPQPMKKFPSLFCAMCSEDDFDYSLGLFMQLIIITN